MVDRPVITASTGAIALGPYGDEAEHTGEPEIIVYTPPFRRFFATDARSVLITLLPNHYNLMPNPAFRAPSTGANSTGWIAYGIEPKLTSYSWRVANTTADASLRAITADTANAGVDPDPGTAPPYVNGQLVKVVDTLAANVTVAWLKIDDAATLTVAQAATVGITLLSPLPKYRLYNPTIDSMSSDSWVGQSVVCSGKGHLRYREGPNKFVYVGPMREAENIQWDPKRGGPEYTFSVYAKGEGEVKLTMSAYNPIDRNDLTSGPEYQNLPTSYDPATEPAGRSAVIDETTGRVWTAIYVGTATNLLTEQQASGTDTLGTTAGFGATGFTLASSTGWAAQGTKSLRCTINAGASYPSAYAGTSTSNAVPVTEGKTYAFTFTVNPGTLTALGSMALAAKFANVGGTQVGSTAASQLKTTNADGSYTFTMSATAPAGAVTVGIYFGLNVGSPVTGEYFYVDKWGVWEGSGGLWALPGDEVLTSPAVAPFYEDIGRGPALAVAQGEWTTIDKDGEWHRVTVRTRSRVEEDAGQITFIGARWIDALIEIRNANELKISSVMLDPIEYPECAYFDGGMTENYSLDDFLWEKDADASVSYYYFDRVIRARWLWQQMGFAVPVGRPYQIFFGSYWRPYVGKTGDTVLLVPSQVAGMSVRSSEPQAPPPF